MQKRIEKKIHQWKETGKMKTSRATYRPKTKKKAIKQAIAIEYGREGVGRAGKRKRRKRRKRKK